MVRCNAINEADKELYKYALYSFFLLVSPLILAGGVGFGLGSVKHGVALIFPFMVLRKFSGGYHAKNLHTCILGSGFLLFLCIMLSMHCLLYTSQHPSSGMSVITSVSITKKLG